MSFAIRPYRRVPVCCPVTYQTGDFEDHDTKSYENRDTTQFR